MYVSVSMLFINVLIPFTAHICSLLIMNRICIMYYSFRSLHFYSLSCTVQNMIVPPAFHCKSDEQ